MAKATVRHPRGRVRRSDKDLVIAAKFAEHGAMLKMLATPTVPSLDWRNMGAVPPVRDQGACGSCWDFSGCGVATMAIIRAGLQRGDGSFNLNEQYVLDCGINRGCSGDDNITVLEQCVEKGVANDSYGPYRGQAGKCSSTPATPLFKISTWGFVDSNGGVKLPSTDDIKEALVAYGPLGCAVAAGGDWDDYTSGEWGGSGSTDVNHDVIIIGWQPSTIQPGKVAWIVRNSWGSSWGMNGYIILTEGADLIGTEAVWAQA